MEHYAKNSISIIDWRGNNENNKIFFDGNKEDISIEYAEENINIDEFTAELIEETEELAEGLTWAIEIYNNIGNKIFYKTSFSD